MKIRPLSPLLLLLFFPVVLTNCAETRITTPGTGTGTGNSSALHEKGMEGGGGVTSAGGGVSDPATLRPN